MDEKTRKKIEAKAESHKWSIDCTCDTDPYGNCWYHLDDTDKAKDSFLKGAEAMEEITKEREKKLHIALDCLWSALAHFSAYELGQKPDKFHDLIDRAHEACADRRARAAEHRAAKGEGRI